MWLKLPLSLTVFMKIRAMSLVLFLRSNKIVLLNFTGSEHFGVKNNKLWATFPKSIVSLSTS